MISANCMSSTLLELRRAVAGPAGGSKKQGAETLGELVADQAIEAERSRAERDQHDEEDEIDERTDVGGPGLAAAERGDEVFAIGGRERDDHRRREERCKEARACAEDERDAADKLQRGDEVGICGGRGDAEIGEELDRVVEVPQLAAA